MFITVLDVANILNVKKSTIFPGSMRALFHITGCVAGRFALSRKKLWPGPSSSKKRRLKSREQIDIP